MAPRWIRSNYNREQPYEEVWEQPMLKVAVKYRVSDVALAKTCRRLQIPLPGRGHWAEGGGEAGGEEAPATK